MHGRGIPGRWMGKLAPLLILLTLAAAAASLPQRAFAAGDAGSQQAATENAVAIAAARGGRRLADR
ncbi:hypothetical protein [Cohnella rhizosphaerae]|uniref:Uncharacterized protein n=1 Tax=Cohnella rhizosphaerae TaxID=1457232 RepID=A0A9X4L560_9BACL|nr:hypothetical protein [Cohnella rhizosphaerae]MDG0814044.1 hypothetical protein [Cohnella rhizosphaerae]